MTGFGTVAIIFSCSLVYFLGWNFEINSFLIYLGIMIGLSFLIWIICVLLIKFERHYYLIDDSGIKLLKNNEVIFELSKTDIIELKYVRYFWTFLFQMGSGYLHLEYFCDGYKDKKFSTILSTGKAIHSISMSFNQSKQVSKILVRYIEVK